MSDNHMIHDEDVAETPLAMALMCPGLIRASRHEEAYAMGCAAIAAAPGDTAIRDLVHGALADDVPLFHLGMLRDEARNACYAAAIGRLVAPGMRVLEIGTGSGLLALMAARAGAEVVTCESNPVIAAAAREIVARNGYADRVRVIGKRSTALKLGIDLDEPCDLLVSEVFGDDLFEEDVLASVADARTRLLRPNAAIIPPRAELRCALVRHDELDPAELGMVMGFDLSPFMPLIKARRYLPARPSAQVALRSRSVAAMEVDFEGEPVGVRHDRITLQSTGGRVDGVAHWLRLDFGGGVTYENEPFVNPQAHWLVSVSGFASPVDTAPGQLVTAEVRLFGTTVIVSADV